MVRLPLLINKQRIKTLEELRENFNLTELIERHKGGQLRAWLNCWDFSSELEQVEALSPDLPEQELLEALCRIFGIEGEAKEQALKLQQREMLMRLLRQKEMLLRQYDEIQRQQEEKKARIQTSKDIMKLAATTAAAVALTPVIPAAGLLVEAVGVAYFTKRFRGVYSNSNDNQDNA